VWPLFHDDHRLETQISFYEQIIAYDVPDRHKTVARLDRGRLFPVVSAAGLLGPIRTYHHRSKVTCMIRDPLTSNRRNMADVVTPPTT
jgi:hypothetical protein